MDDAFQARRGAAMLLLTTSAGLNRKAGSFLGQCVVDPAPLPSAQAKWLNELLSRAGYPPLAEAQDSSINEPLASLVWPARATDPEASTSLSVADLIAGGGGDALRSYLVSRMGAAEAETFGSARRWSQFALDHLAERVGDRADDGGVDVSSSSVQMVLAYINWLEGALDAGGAA